jgi:N6-L-threonylcarbamoyladenine synthase
LLPIILAIESSCDDTSIAILKDDAILVNLVASQKIHEEYGGIVPEVASRQHLKNIIPTIALAVKKAGIQLTDLQAIAVTKGPGLLGSLVVGVNVAKAIALSLNLPLIEVNHMKAHVLAHFIDDPKPSFPFLCLTVSGGHTQIVLVKDFLELEVIGQTRDDAAGEAYDKSGKLLGLPYPAGPLIDKYAALGKVKYSFTEPKIDGLDFSFSGMKTAIRYFLRDSLKQNDQFIVENMNDICASIQFSINSFLRNKLIKAASETGIAEIAIAGGVSANKGLRKMLTEEAEKQNWNFYIPQFQYCTDNAAMIAKASSYYFEKGIFSDLTMKPSARMPIS